MSLILIVDDEPFNVDYLEQELEDLGHDTISAANGQEALAQVAAVSPDLVLLDIMMPIMDGFQVLERLKAGKVTRDIPVIVISAAHDVESVVRGIEQGAEDYLPKPFDPVLLQARINASLEKKRYRDQEIEYLRQVERLTDAASAVESGTFALENLGTVAARNEDLRDNHHTCRDHHFFCHQGGGRQWTCTPVPGGRPYHPVRRGTGRTDARRTGAM